MSPMLRCAGAADRVDVNSPHGDPADLHSFKWSQKMKRIAPLGLALGFAFALATSASAQVKFGVAGPITGPNAATGAQMKNGVEQAVADINPAAPLPANKT